MRTCVKAVLVAVVMTAVVVSVLAYPYILAHFPGSSGDRARLSVDEPSIPENAPRPCKCECFDILTIEYAMHIRDQRVIRTERLLKRLVPEPGDIHGAVPRPETELNGVEARYVIDSENGDVKLKIIAFRPAQQSPEAPGTVYVIVVLDSQSRFGLILYRVSGEEAFAYIVVPGDIPKAQYITVEFTGRADMYDYMRSVGYGLTKISYVTGEDKWSLIAGEIDKAIATIKAVKRPELTGILEFHGVLSALVVDGGWDCFVGCAQVCGVADLTLGAICSIACGLCTLEKISCAVCGYCLIVLGSSTLGCLIGCGIGCLIRGG
ncbi:MAG: hypothetical protein QW700_04760 [Desulfurococcaceae archaeon]